MVLLAGILIPENLRIRRSRIFAPQVLCSRLTFRMQTCASRGLSDPAAVGYT